MSPTRRRCAYCGASGHLTREHVYGAYSGESGYKHRSTRVPDWVGGASVVADVCATCNNEKLSGVDSYGRRFLDCYLETDPADLEGSLLQVDRKALLRVVLKASYNAARGAGDDICGLRACAAFILGDDPEPPFPVVVMAGVVPGPFVRRIVSGEYDLPEALREGVALCRFVANRAGLFLVVGWRRRTDRAQRRRVVSFLHREANLVEVTDKPVRLRRAAIETKFWEQMGLRNDR